jgi:hypothetical protein
MRAIVQHAYGASDVLSLQDIDEPTPGPHEVLVRVYAASINHGDWFVTSGRPYVMRAALGLHRPRVAVRGRDLAGRVEAVGAAVTGFRPGDDVYAETTTGSFAELACVPERLLALKPTNLTFEQAAAVPVAAVTAPAEDASCQYGIAACWFMCMHPRIPWRGHSRRHEVPPARATPLQTQGLTVRPASGPVVRIPSIAVAIAASSRMPKMRASTYPEKVSWLPWRHFSQLNPRYELDHEESCRHRCGTPGTGHPALVGGVTGRAGPTLCVWNSPSWGLCGCRRGARRWRFAVLRSGRCWLTWSRTPGGSFPPRSC